MKPLSEEQSKRVVEWYNKTMRNKHCPRCKGDVSYDVRGLAEVVGVDVVVFACHLVFECIGIGLCSFSRQ